MTTSHDHREALRYFVKNETSMGCYGTGSGIHDAREAMKYFAEGCDLDDNDGTNLRYNDLRLSLRVMITERRIFRKGFAIGLCLALVPAAISWVMR